MSEKQVTLITLAVLAVILIAGGGAIYYLKFKVLTSKEAELKVLRDAVAADEDKVNKIPGIQKAIADLAAQEAEKAKRIPPLDIMEYDNFINQIEAMKKLSGVQIDTSSLATRAAPKGTPLPPKIHKVTYDFTVNGAFFQLLRFINLMEQQQRFMRVETFNISTGTATGSNASIQFRSLKVSVYTYTYRPEPVVAKKGDEKKTPEVLNPSTEAPQ